MSLKLSDFFFSFLKKKENGENITRILDLKPIDPHVQPESRNIERKTQSIFFPKERFLWPSKKNQENFLKKFCQQKFEENSLSILFQSWFWEIHQKLFFSRRNKGKVLFEKSTIQILRIKIFYFLQLIEESKIEFLLLLSLNFWTENDSKKLY